jgi:leucyl aminopeptidase
MSVFRVESKPFQDIEFDVVVVNIFQEENEVPKDLVALDKVTNGFFKRTVGEGVFSADLFEVTSSYRPNGLTAARLLFVGSGSRQDFSFEIACQVAATAARFVSKTNAREIAFLMRGDLPPERRAQACVEGALLGIFETSKYKTMNRSRPALDSIVILTNNPNEEGKLRQGASRGQLYAESTNYARHLVNEPSNILTPRRFAGEAAALAKELDMDIDVLGIDRMKEIGLNAILGVARGSDEPPQLFVLRYNGGNQKTPTVALVGKGLTFDAGGISLKEPEGMHYMKYDMAGGAAVLGAMKIIGKLKPKINVLGIVAATENMPGGKSQKPGDVVTAFNRKTIEIISTDAEGRLVLADAIAYARHLGATHLVDIATLTGSAAIALGDITTAVMANNESWAAELLKAGKHAGEKMWPLPTFHEYRELIESGIADMRNMADRKADHINVVPAGAIVGAMFLREFAEDTPWVHLDIAGTAWNSRTLRYMATGPTGVGVRTLATLVLSMGASANSKP